METTTKFTGPRQLIEPLSVLDVLGGEISGNYKEDIKKINSFGYECAEYLYNEAYQLSEQP